MPVLHEAGAAIVYAANIGVYGSLLSQGRRVEKERISLRLLTERRPERMTWIHPDDAKLAREEFQFLQRKGEIFVFGRAIEICIKLRGEEIAVDHVAFELGHVDAVGGKTAHRLVERGGQVADPEHEGGDQRSRSLLGPIGLACQY